MHRLSTFTGISTHNLRSILTFSYGATLMAAAVVYVCLRLLFYEIVNPFFEEVINLAWTGLVAFCIGTLISMILILVYCAGKIRQSIATVAIPFKKPILATCVFLLLLLIGLNSMAQSAKGVKKDPGTGLTATYQTIVPEKVLLVMNNEVINHTDIPIGESFILVNKNVKGFVEKNGKVSVGCSLLITDKNGSKLLEAADLFKDRDLFDKKDMSYLKCTINTGAPMKWEEKYQVRVIFWDKFGPGKIVNKVTIRMIDIP